MKVKNLMFSGFAAAMFAGVMGSADAATYNLASKDYVDTKITDVDTRLQGVDTAIEKKQDKLTAGTGVTIDTVDGVTTIDTKPILIGEQDVPVADAITNVTNEVTNITNVLGEIPDNTTVQAELDKKLDTTTYNAFVADQAQRDKNQDDAIALIEGGEGGTGGITDLVNRVSTAEGEIDTLQEDIDKKEDLANKVVSADELTNMQSDEKATKYTSVAVAEAIAQSIAATAAGAVGTRVDTLETALNDETDGLVKKVADLVTADETMGGRVDTLEANVGNTSVEDQIDNKINELNLAGTYETKAAVTEAKYVSAKDATAQGGYLVKVDDSGNVSMLEVAIVNGDGTKDMITDTALDLTVD